MNVIEGTSISSRSRDLALFSENGGESEKAGKRKSTKFDRVLDDFVGKRYGAGEAFYGKRKSELSEDEFQILRRERSPKQDEVEIVLKPNAILICGGLDDINQWVVFDLIEKGFDIRIATSDMKKAVAMFGLAGNNVDIVEIKDPNEAIDEDYEYLINKAQAVIISDSFSRNAFGNNISEENLLVGKLVKYLIDGKKSSGDIKKIVLVSHAWGISDRNLGKKFIEVVQSPFTGMNGGPNSNCATFHERLENVIRESDYEYVIIQAPSKIMNSRIASTIDLNLVQAEPARDDHGIGVLDLAEVTVQSLLQDVGRVTFGVYENQKFQFDDEQPLVESNAMDIEYGRAEKKELNTKRVVRPSYYNILEMQDREMKSSYLLRNTEVLRNQIDEDQNVEKFWDSKFRDLRLD